MQTKMLIFAFIILNVNIKAQDTLKENKLKEPEVMYFSEDGTINKNDTIVIGTKINVVESQQDSTINVKKPNSIHSNVIPKTTIVYNTTFASELRIMGASDARLYHKKTGQHIVLGILFGGFAIVGVALSRPTPERGKLTSLLSKNRKYFNDPIYRKAYRKAARGKNVINTTIGWGIWISYMLISQL